MLRLRCQQRPRLLLQARMKLYRLSVLLGCCSVVCSLRPQRSCCCCCLHGLLQGAAPPRGIELHGSHALPSPVE